MYVTSAIELGDAQKFRDLALSNGLISSACIYIDAPGGSLQEALPSDEL